MNASMRYWICLTELITVHGVFHAKLHFSSSRATLWLMDDPYRFRIHSIADLTDADLCLAYPRHDYPSDALVPADSVREILELLSRTSLHGRDALPALRHLEHLQRHRGADLLLRRLTLYALGGIPEQEPGLLAGDIIGDLCLAAIPFTGSNLSTDLPNLLQLTCGYRSYGRR